MAVKPTTDREEVARLLAKYNLLAVPVVDDEQRLVGTITVDDEIDALVQEQTEDVHKFGGLQALESALPEHRSLDDDPEAGRLAVKGNGRIWSG